MIRVSDGPGYVYIWNGVQTKIPLEKVLWADDVEDDLPIKDEVTRKTNLIADDFVRNDTNVGQPCRISAIVIVILIK